MVFLVFPLSFPLSVLIIDIQAPARAEYTRKEIVCMTRDEFQDQANKLFFKTKESLIEDLLKSSAAIFESAKNCPDKVSALHQVSIELSQKISALSFESSCDYSKQLALLLFDHFSN